MQIADHRFCTKRLGRRFPGNRQAHRNGILRAPQQLSKNGIHTVFGGFAADDDHLGMIAVQRPPGHGHHIVDAVGDGDACTPKIDALSSLAVLSALSTIGKTDDLGSHLVFTGLSVYADAGDHRQLGGVSAAATKEQRHQAANNHLFHRVLLLSGVLSARKRPNFRMDQ